MHINSFLLTHNVGNIIVIGIPIIFSYPSNFVDVSTNNGLDINGQSTVIC